MVAARTLSLLAVLAALVSAACNEATPAPIAPVSVAIGDAAADAPAILPSPEAGSVTAAPSPDFYACAADRDCVAVPRVGCCYNGHKEAINAASADAYKRSFTCPNPNQICPLYLVNDMREPECNAGARRCEMVAIDQIKCGGLIPNPHACPEGYRCEPGPSSDAPGACKK